MAKSEIVPFTKLELVEWLGGADLPLADDPEDAEYAMALRILGAQSADDVLVRVPRASLSQVVGEPFTLYGVTWKRSTIKGSKNGRYAELNVTNAKDQQWVLTTGSTQVMLQLQALEQLGAMPCLVRVGASDDPGDGSSPANWLEAVESF